jgi:two-component system cell cycle sensor histidine kinase/response regulator CckA
MQVTPKKPLRILHLEDDLRDHELVRNVFEHGGVGVHLVHAASRAEFEAALDGEKFDLILADFNLPDLAGADALALARKKCPDAPYLIVSGTIGEEHAVESFKNGATDYILKNRLERLLPAVQRAVHNATERARRRADELALRESEERFREMAGIIEDVYWISGAGATGLHYVSPAYERIWGRSVAALYARPAEWTDAIVPDDRPKVQAAREHLAQGGEHRVEYRIQRPDGTVRWIDDRSYAVPQAGGGIKRTVGVAMDITRRKELETELLHAQKMDAIGRLAGGMAHDFNNVLTVVTGYARLLLDSGTMPLSAVEPLTQIYTAGGRAANLVRQLLVFSRKQVVERRAVDLNEVIGEISRMLGRLIGEHIRLRLALAPADATVEADPGMLEQVLMNLAVNARDAMGEGGELTIRSELVTITPDRAQRHPGARPGEFVCLSVSDTGCGIPPETLQRIFEPFFTTKEAGRGTGLGLAMVFGIVQQHQGWIEVESAVGVGTTFRVLLPIVPHAPVAAAHPARPAAPHGGSETILLVEDETAVREFAVTVLRGHGYRVLQACSGVDALEVWKWHHSRISLLFTDLVMPDNPTGMELAATIHREKPALPVLFASGYLGDIFGQEFRLPAGAHFVQKPYKPQTLAEAVRNALDGRFDQ